MNNLEFSKTKKIIVYGDVILDHYIYGQAERISPEAPVPIVKHIKEEYKLGGAANVFQNLVSLGCQPELISVVGSDSNGVKLLELMNGSLVHMCQEQGKITPTKTRIISDGQQLLRLDNETTHSISRYFQDVIVSYIKNMLDKCNVFILSDYGKGCFADLNPYFIPTLIEEAKKQGVLVIIDPHNGTFDSKFSAYSGAWCIKANRKQAEKLTDTKINNIDDCEIAIEKLIEKYNLQFAIITMSEDGLLIKERFAKSKHVKGKACEIFDVTGAGDSAIACFAWAVASGHSAYDAAEIANAGGNIKVRHHGTYAVTQDDLRNYFDNTPKKIVSIHKIRKLVDKYKNIVFTNGCFDIIHPGHIAMLQFAKEQGDVLVVGVNSDSSIKQLKGPPRPIIPQNDRAKVIAALECVDYVCIFDEDTPHNLIKEIEPHIHVKGSDHKGETDGVPQTLFFERIGDYSTTKLVGD